MQIREDEMTQYEAMGNFTDECIQEIARASHPPPKPRRSRGDDHRGASETSELEALALPLENTCPRLA